jgi:hypothetical protein
MVYNDTLALTAMSENAGTPTQMKKIINPPNHTQQWTIDKTTWSKDEPYKMVHPDNNRFAVCRVYHSHDTGHIPGYVQVKQSDNGDPTPISDRKCYYEINGGKNSADFEYLIDTGDFKWSELSPDNSSALDMPLAKMDTGDAICTSKTSSDNGLSRIGKFTHNGQSRVCYFTNGTDTQYPSSMAVLNQY